MKCNATCSHWDRWSTKTLQYKRWRLQPPVSTYPFISRANSPPQPCTFNVRFRTNLMDHVCETTGLTLDIVQNPLQCFEEIPRFRSDGILADLLSLTRRFSGADEHACLLTKNTDRPIGFGDRGEQHAADGLLSFYKQLGSCSVLAPK